MLTCHWTDARRVARAGNGVGRVRAVRDRDWFDGCVVTEARRAGYADEEIPGLAVGEVTTVAFGFVARTVKGVEPAAAADVVVIVMVEVFDVSPLAKLTLLGLNDAVAPAGRPVALRLRRWTPFSGRRRSGSR